MTTFAADWLLPIAGAPIRGGSIVVEDGRIGAVAERAPGDAVRVGRAAILPALVNAHTHLELSFLQGRVPPRESFNDWVRTLMARRREHSNPGDPLILDAARRAIEQAHATGTGLFGDVSNTLITVPLLRDARLPAQVFYEVLGFNAPDAEGRVREARAKADTSTAGDGDVRVSVAPHAPYSVSPALFAAVRGDMDRHPGQVSTVHLGESTEEVEFLRTGTGAVRAMLAELGVWTDTWRPPGASPVTYLSNLGFLDSRVLVVHGVQFGGDDLARLRALDATLVSCPRSNRYVGVGSPPLEAFYAAGVRVALGTDSLASVHDLNMFAELAEARRIAPRVPARDLLRSATLTGARALARDAELGSIEPGKRATLIAVRVPEGVTDVEEYLVSGIAADAVTWLARD